MSATLKKLWRKSASLIVVGRNNNLVRENGFDYKVYFEPERKITEIALMNNWLMVLLQVLVLERPSRSTFPGSHVFPGGVCEQSDESSDWLKQFKSCGLDETKLNSIASRFNPSESITNEKPATGLGRWVDNMFMSLHTIHATFYRSSDKFHPESRRCARHSKSLAFYYAEIVTSQKVEHRSHLIIVWTCEHGRKMYIMTHPNFGNCVTH